VDGADVVNTNAILIRGLLCSPHPLHPFGVHRPAITRRLRDLYAAAISA